MIRQAAISCGRLRTRLGALTTQNAGPLLEVGGAAFLDILLFELGRDGIRRIQLLAGHAAQHITDYAASTPLKASFDLEMLESPKPDRPSRTRQLARGRSFSDACSGWDAGWRDLRRLFIDIGVPAS
jgi:NDP-sugar pyrophosphorylase family protein